MAATIALNVSNRLLTVAAAMVCIMAAQLVTASCTPEPASYAARTIIQR